MVVVVVVVVCCAWGWYVSEEIKQKQLLCVVTTCIPHEWVPEFDLWVEGQRWCGVCAWGMRGWTQRRSECMQLGP